MYEWTDKMKNVGPSPELEAVTRQAVIKSIEFLSALPDGAQLPAWNGNRVLVPVNDAAVKMHEVITAHLGPEVPRAKIVTTAVLAAQQACRGGKKGADAWAALVAKLEAK